MDKPYFGRSVFICSKPLQFFNCASIVRHYQLENCEMHIVTHGIADLDGFMAFIATSAYKGVFGDIKVHANYLDAVSVIRGSMYESLFIEDDRVSLYHIFAPFKKKYLVVFEEGFGTYCSDYLYTLKGLRLLKWRALSLLTGCGLQFGGGRKTDYVMVQFVCAYKRLNPACAQKAISFPGIIDEINRELVAWGSILNPDLKKGGANKERAALILGTWGGVGEDIVRKIAEEYSVTYYKAHPHDGMAPSCEKVRVISASWVPAEAYISALSSKFQCLTVYHFSSSSFFYCRDKFLNVKFVDLLEDPRFLSVCNAYVSGQG